MLNRPNYHTRHIPREMLNFNTPTAKEVFANGLCDFLTGDTPIRLKDCGVEVVETRLVWWEFEPQPNHFDFSRLEKDLDVIEEAGFKPGLFPWFNHPPAWYDNGHVRFRCLEHDTDSTMLSIWDPKTIEVFDRLHGEISSRFAKRLAFLYLGLAGDYGEYAYPTAVDHYLFSPPHRHNGFWCGDVLARKAFSDAMRIKYGSVNSLNKQWGTCYTSWDDVQMPTLPLGNAPMPWRYDFSQWYTEEMAVFTEKICKIGRTYFPEIKMGIPLGFPDEALMIGQIKSRAVKIAAKYNIIPRWTGMAFLDDFEHCNVLARRYATPASFYGTEFATEAALILPRERASNALYEALANGASIIHDDPQNIMRAEEIHQRLRKRLVVSAPQTNIAILYPLESEFLELNNFNFKSWIDRAAGIRSLTDYHICDHFMIEDGFLKNINCVLVLGDDAIPASTLPALTSFLQRGGQMILATGASLGIITETVAIEPMDKYLSDIQGQVQYFESLSQLAALLGVAPSDGSTLQTTHTAGISTFNKAMDEISFHPESSKLQPNNIRRI